MDPKIFLKLNSGKGRDPQKEELMVNNNYSQLVGAGMFIVFLIKPSLTN